MIYTMYDDTIWLFNIAMERSTIFNFDKPSISMGHGFHGYVSHNQRVYIGMNIFLWCLVNLDLKDHPQAPNLRDNHPMAEHFWINIF